MDGKESNNSFCFLDGSYLGSCESNEFISFCIDGRTHLKDWLIVIPSDNLSIFSNCKDEVTRLVTVKVEGFVINERIHTNLNI